MRRSSPAAILVILVFASVVGICANALADTYTYTGLGGGLHPVARIERDQCVRGDGERPCLAQHRRHRAGSMSEPWRHRECARI